MNRNMSAIGLKTIERNRKALSRIVGNMAKNPDTCISYPGKDGKTQVEQYGYIGEDFGLVLYGARNHDDEVKIRRWNTFAFSDASLKISKVSFEKMRNGEVFAYCEDEATGNEFEFRLNNIRDFENFPEYSKQMILSEATANIVALGRVGNVIFPVEKNEDSLKMRAKEEDMRRDLIRKLRKGDETAERKLVERSLEIAATVRERLKTEDVLSVFEGYLLPYGDDEGAYAVLGDIKGIARLDNVITEETVCALTLDVTGVPLRVLVNELDVVGLPMEGMRFMGICDLQGSIKFI